MNPRDERARDRLGVRLSLIALLVLFLGLYAAGYWFLSDRMPPGTKVAGISIGGKDTAQARLALIQGLATKQSTPVRLSYQGHVFTVTPRQAGLRVNVDATMAAAGGGRSFDPRDMLKVILGAGAVAPVLDVNQPRLDHTLDRLAKNVDRAVVAPTVHFGPKVPVVQPSRPGIVLDRAATADLITGSYLVVSSPVPLPTRTVAPGMTTPQVTAAARTFAARALNRPVVLVVAGHRISLPVAGFRPTVSMSLHRRHLVPSVDPTRLQAPLRQVLSSAGVLPISARVVLRGNRPVVEPATPGVSVSADGVADRLLTLLVHHPRRRVLHVPTSPARPPVSTATARAWHIEHPVATATVRLPYSGPRNHNAALAARALNGRVLRPGARLSFNDVVGPRTRGRGYVHAGIAQDAIAADDRRGGVSPVATALFDAGLAAGLSTDSRYSHRHVTPGYPVGRDAVVHFPRVDLALSNHGQFGVLVQTSVTRPTARHDGAVTVRLWSGPVGHVVVRTGPRRHAYFAAPQYVLSDRCSPRRPRPGFIVDVVRRVRHRTDQLQTTYAPLARVICHAPPR
ncbi:MAG: VanW family protein [Nocardioidaceae bacterium]